MTSITVLYKANCRFCRLCKAFIEKRDPMKQIQFFDINTYAFPYAGKAERGLKPPLTVIENDVVFTRYVACLRIAYSMSHPWPFIARILNLIPTPIGNWGYNMIADHRDFLMVFFKKRHYID